MKMENRRRGLSLWNYVGSLQNVTHTYPKDSVLAKSPDHIATEEKRQSVMPIGNNGEGGNAKIVATIDRERLTNDMMNTSVMATLIGGFALNSLTPPTSEIDQAIYALSYVAVHACTCSALTSAFIFRVVNKMEVRRVQHWHMRNIPFCSLLYLMYFT
jgi:hypothetical protein